MSDNSQNSASHGRTDPRENRERAWEIAVNPQDYTKIQCKLLIDRGLNHYRDAESDGNGVNEVQLMTDVSQFIGDSLDRPREQEIFDAAENGDIPYINQPGCLVLVMGLASLLVRKHEAIIADSRKPRIHEHVRELFLYHIHAATYFAEDRHAIRVSMGEIVYGRDQEDSLGPPVGRPVEGIERLPEIDNQFYFKIPLVHANRQCEARENNEPRGAMRCVIKGPYVYVPADDLKEKYNSLKFHTRNGVPDKIEYVLKNTVDEDTLEVFQRSLSGVNKRIQELADMGQDQLLFQERQYPAKLKAVLMALDNADAEDAKLGDPLTAKEIHTVVKEFASETDIGWVKGIAENLSTPQSISGMMSGYIESDDVSNVSVNKYDNRANEYILEYKIGNFKKIDVTDIEDLLELPCMQNLHDSILQKKPVRWELYSFVRYIFEVDTEFTIEDVKEWFNQYPWYKADVTEYQAEYEERRVMGDGDRPLPISCNNDNKNWADHCIGKENCEYSLYRSVDLRPDVYDRTGDN